MLASSESSHCDVCALAVKANAAEKPEQTLKDLKKRSGKDIWLMGGGSLFGSLLDLAMVDTVEVAIIPVVLGAGIPLLPPPANR